MPGSASSSPAVTASSAWQTERIRSMNPGDAVDVAGYTLTFRGVSETKGPNYRAVTGRFDLERGGRVLTVLRPEKRDYPAERSQTTEAAIHTTWLADIYAVLGERAANGAWTARLYHNPLVPWIWVGAVVMAAGGRGLAYRPQAPDRRAAPGKAEPGGRGRRPAMTAIRASTAVPVAVFALLAAVFGFYLHQIGTGEKDAAQVPSALIGKPAPEFDLPPIEGMEGGLKTADLRGEVAMVNVFASWCPPCQQEHPFLMRLARAGVPVYGINIKDRPKKRRARSSAGSATRTAGSART